ncbi:DegT/DnrJ/EryC1/StrS family aminotransferase [Flavitalea sp.]|nr:DegT/DnrJ/EryC1/StrS family aminotransferase [Flavitalea sp.]
MKKNLERREFLNTMSVAGVGLALGIPNIVFAADNKPALLGGPKSHPGGFSGWPLYDHTEETALADVLKSKQWGRLGGNVMNKFEKEYQNLFGAKRCLGVSSGTSALYTILGAMDLGPGDEVIIPVYTFVATYNVVVLNYALPILVDTDIESFQIDAGKIESAITKQTKIIMPVHIGGSPANLDKIMAVAKKANVPVVEDACQAHLAEWRGKKVGTYGLAGAFSFQASKNLNCAEGGAIITNDDAFIKTCYSFHNQGQGGQTAAYTTGAGTRGTNLRLTEFQGAILLAQMSRLVDQSNRRSENAIYLTKLLNEIPGIKPAKLYEGTTKSAYHLYMFRYDKTQFAGLSREKFQKALNAEGVPCSSGYGMMNKDSYVTGLAKNRHYLKIYGEKTMNEWLERNQCPQNDILTGEQSVWLTQTMLLGTKKDMDQIADGVRKIQKYAKEIDKV